MLSRLSNMKKINLFLIGAPKSGTTAMAYYLSCHPSVYMCSPKEPHYFSDDLSKYAVVDTLDDYHGLFKGSRNDYSFLGEASVWYLYSDSAIKRIYEYNQTARIVVMLRNPVEMIYSMHSQHVYSNDEDVVDFGKAFYLQKQRAQGALIPKGCRSVKALMYSEIAKYDEQLTRLYSYFPKNQVKVVLYDDFSKNPKLEYDKLLEFLALDQFSLSDYKVVNSNKIPKSIFVNKLLKYRPQQVIKFRDALKKMLGINQFYLSEILNGVNSCHISRAPLEKELTQSIYNDYSRSIKNLNLMLNDRVKNWVRV